MRRRERRPTSAGRNLILPATANAREYRRRATRGVGSAVLVSLVHPSFLTISISVRAGLCIGTSSGLSPGGATIESLALASEAHAGPATAFCGEVQAVAGTRTQPSVAMRCLMQERMRWPGYRRRRWRWSERGGCILGRGTGVYVFRRWSSSTGRRTHGAVCVSRQETLVP